jgi:hypothetical protein
MWFSKVESLEKDPVGAMGSQVDGNTLDIVRNSLHTLLQPRSCRKNFPKG